MKPNIPFHPPPPSTPLHSTTVSLETKPIIQKNKNNNNNNGNLLLDIPVFYEAIFSRAHY